MTDHKRVRIGCASAFWGDTPTAAAQLVEKGDLDYLVFDYLSEITMSILASKKRKNPASGFAEDFISTVAPHFSKLRERNTTVVTNAGGINPAACRDALMEAAARVGVTLRVAIVEGDDLTGRWPELNASGGVTAFESGPFDSVPKDVESANAYLGATPIAQALAAGADVVLTGRCVDSALALGPLLHEFGWGTHDYDKLAAGSLAGHLIECGAQVTGGNFTDWRLASDGYENMGFPIVEVEESGTFTLTKPVGTGGLVTPHTVGEQLLYEIGDPRAYFLPDVTCDFTDVELRQAGKDRVEITACRGLPPTDDYKVSATFRDGYRLTALFMLVGEEAPEKGRRVADAILNRARRIFAERGLGGFRAVQPEVLGAEHVYGPLVNDPALKTREVVVRIAVHHDQREALEIFAREIAQASTAMAPGITGYFGGRPSVSPVVKLFSAFVRKAELEIAVECEGKRELTPVPGGRFSWDMVSEQPPANREGKTYASSVPLRQLAVARSGDKGNQANIGVIARDPGYFKYIGEALTEEAVAEHFRHFLEGEVSRWELRGICGFNFLLRNALGGGGIASLRVDSQGKSYAQILLDYPIPVPKDLAETFDSQ